MRMLSGSPAFGLLHRTVALVLVVAIFQVSAAGQQPAIAGPSVGQRVDVVLTNGTHVIGTVKAWRPHEMSIEQATGARTTARYVDVQEIRDLDTRMVVAMPVATTPHYDNRWVKPVLILAPAGFGLVFFITCGFKGRCN